LNERRGIVLAGGYGTRLYPITLGASKHLLPVYDKPMVYYPISVLMLAGIRKIAVISTPDDLAQYRRLLGDGNQWGLSFTFIEQAVPEGLSQAYVLAKEFLEGAPSALVLGDNLFYGHGLPEILRIANKRTSGGTIFACKVSNPEQFGVVSFDDKGRATAIVEKPPEPKSDYAVTGLYFLDGSAPERAKKIVPSQRGEYEITALLESYRAADKLAVELLGRGFAWLDMGTHGNLLDAGNFVRTLQLRQGTQIACLEEIAYNNGWLPESWPSDHGAFLKNSTYGQYVKSIMGIV